MNINITDRSTKDIVLEAAYGKIPFSAYKRISLAKDLVSVQDLRRILGKKDYTTVEKCVREFFAFQTIELYSKYQVTIGSAYDKSAEDIFPDWLF